MTKYEVVRRMVVESKYEVDAESTKAAAEMVLNRVIDAGEPYNEFVVRATVRRVKRLNDGRADTTEK